MSSGPGAGYVSPFAARLRERLQTKDSRAVSAGEAAGPAVPVTAGAPSGTPSPAGPAVPEPVLGRNVPTQLPVSSPWAQLRTPSKVPSKPLPSPAGPAAFRASPVARPPMTAAPTVPRAVVVAPQSPDAPRSGFSGAPVRGGVAPRPIPSFTYQPAPGAPASGRPADQRALPLPALRVLPVQQVAPRPVPPRPVPPAKKKSPPKKRGPVTAQEAQQARRETLNRLGLDEAREALLCLPESYADLREVCRRLPEENDVAPRLYLLQFTGAMSGFDASGNFLPLEVGSNWRLVRRLDIELADSEGSLAQWSIFGSPFPYRGMQVGEGVPLVCRSIYSDRRGIRVLLDADRPPAHAVGRVWVKYLGITGRVSGDAVADAVRSQIDNPDAYLACATKLVGALGMREEAALDAVGCTEFTSFKSVLHALHEPRTPEIGAAAHAVAHKLAAAAVQASALRHNLRHPHPQAPLAIDPAEIGILARTQPETLTGDQLKAAHAIMQGLRDPRPLNDLLSGDVGTGKTLAYLLPLVAAHRAGAKCAIIAPTSILADQIAREVLTRFGGVIKGVERVATGRKIHDKQSILVGTPGLVSVATRAGYEPNFLVCDEQHKMSTDVRERLVKPWTHVLEVSATPMPRSLAQAFFGGKGVINIRECPVKKNIQCMVGDVTERRKFVGMLRWALDNGQRAAVIYPLVNQAAAASGAARLPVLAAGDAPAIPRPAASGSAGLGEPGAKQVESVTRSVIEGARVLEESFPGKVIAIHGQMREADIRRALDLVRSGERPLVVASTVLETGIDIPGITAMIVRNADYFGVSQLHQLRGRLARKGGDAWFGMMVEDEALQSPETMVRLQTVAEVQDGFELAEHDLRMRGFGDLDGSAQSGATDTVFKLLRLRPEDFLRKKLESPDVHVPLPQQAAREEVPPVMRGDQPRLFS